MKNGVGFERAFGVESDFKLTRAMRGALAIIFSELDSGRCFNFSTWGFDPLPKS